MSKPIVHYTAVPPWTRDRMIVGRSCAIRPHNHPSELVTNENVCITSPIVKINPLGFETENTIYVEGPINEMTIGLEKALGETPANGAVLAYGEKKQP